MKSISTFGSEDFKVKTIDGISIIKIYMLRVTAKDAKTLKQIFNSVIAAGHFRIIIDFTECQFVDSTVIGVILNILKEAGKTNCDIRAITSLGSINILFAQTKLNKIIKCYNTQEQALNSFA